MNKKIRLDKQNTNVKTKQKKMCIDFSQSLANPHTGKTRTYFTIKNVIYLDQNAIGQKSAQ